MSDPRAAHQLHLSVVLPVFRSRAILDALTAALTGQLQEMHVGYEIIFVNDACPDGSDEKLIELCGRYPHLIIVDLAENVGQHRAVLTGLTIARGRYVAVMDADLQDPPAALPALLNKMEEGFGVVFAGRRGRYEAAGRLLTSKIFKWLLHKAAGVPADAGMFFMMSRATALEVARVRFFFPFVVAMIGCTGVKTDSIPVERNARPSGRSTYSSIKRLKTASLALAASIAWRLNKKRRYRPAPYCAPIVRLETSAKLAGRPEDV